MGAGHSIVTTLKDKPGKYTAQDIIDYLDDIEHITPFSFIDLEHPYFFTANSRLTLFADETRWALVFEKSGQNPRWGRIGLWLNYFGNCLRNLKTIENTGGFYNSQTFILIDQDELSRIEIDAEITDSVKLAFRGDIKLRAQSVKIPETKHGYCKWIPDILTRDHPKYVAYRDLVRFLAYEYEELCRATENEVRHCLPTDLPKILAIDEWHHRSYSVYNGVMQGAPPSTYETYPLIAEVLETKDPSRFQPTLSPNNHWTHWPRAGAL